MTKSAIQNVTIYEFEVYDPAADGMRKSSRFGTKESIEQVARGLIIGQGILVDNSVVSSPNTDIDGFTIRDFNPKPRTGFQTPVAC